MRNFAAFIGVVIGGNLGWLFGTVADGYVALVTETRPGHTFTYVMTFLMASVFAFSLRRVVGELSARHAAAESNVERAALKLERTRPRTGRTPPAPFPALQA